MKWQLNKIQYYFIKFLKSENSNQSLMKLIITEQHQEN